MTLSASTRPEAVSSTRWTMPSPPAPMRSSSRYLSGTGIFRCLLYLLLQETEGFADAIDALDDVGHRTGVRQAHEPGGAEAGAGDHGDLAGLEQEAAQRGVVGDGGAAGRAPADERRQVGEGVERAQRL